MAKTPKRRSGAREASSPVPSKQEILDFIESAPERAGKREIARAFGIKGAARIDLKRLLREMADEGLISSGRKRITRAGELPPVGVIVITGRDAHGELVATPESWDSEAGGPPPRILVAGDRRSRAPAPGVGDRVLARLRKRDEEEGGEPAYEARIIRKLGGASVRLLGVFRSLPDGRGVIDPVDRKQLREWIVQPEDCGGAQDGELVRFELARSGRYGIARARVLERLGNPEAQGAVSLIAIEQHGLRTEFPDEVLQEAEALRLPGPEGREDLRDIPLITIDPADARDHDDAVWAAADEDPDNPGGWVVIVAIADVAWFVRPGSALDREALLRGNSAYFPDRVVPMLPERISADLCSLREGEDRACLAVRMVFDKAGHKKSHKFVRGLMRSAASLAYEQAQRAIDGMPDDATGPLLEPVLKPLWGAYRALAKARENRGPLELDLPERKIILDAQGRVADVVTPPRLEAHRLIEEFMIQANVSAAETLEKERSPLIYRVHDAPSKEKLAALADFLATIDIRMPGAGRLLPEHFNRILEAAREGKHSELVSEVVLRAQSQAEYTPANLGHFGLNLRRYAHFTSPIRRYADLIVHRALIRALKLGEGGLTDGEIARLDEISESISTSERTAMAAERQTVDRLITAYLADRIGATFSARVSGVTRSGLFVRLSDTGADGFVAASSMIGDFYRYYEPAQALIGERSGLGYQLGDQVEVRLVEAIPSAGALRFDILTEPREIKAPERLRTRRAGRGRSSRPPARSRKGTRRR
ncbi:MAG: ribonuclease R [Alphaproteobacteria bacterium]|nr:MAG: ribonuclease R [Alphaproteobacteria bacterium]